MHENHIRSFFHSSTWVKKIVIFALPKTSLLCQFSPTFVCAPPPLLLFETSFLSLSPLLLLFYFFPLVPSLLTVVLLHFFPSPFSSVLPSKFCL